MSLSTLLEAAKYLDYLDSNTQQGQSPSQQQHQQQQIQLSDQSSSKLHPQSQRTQPTSVRRSNRRQRASKKDAANTMVAMSLPASTGSFQIQNGVPIPMASGSGIHSSGGVGIMGGPHHTSLSSSFTTESPLSSFASTALLCSKVSGVTSASSSSAASSLSSSDSSSSCGEILMGDNDFNQSTSTPTSNTSAAAGTTGAAGGKSTRHKREGNSKSNTLNSFSAHLQQSNNSNNMDANYHLQSLAINNSKHHHQQPAMVHKYSSPGSFNDRGQSFARYIAATSSGPQLITMTTTPSGGVTSASAPIDGRIRAGHVIQAATQSTNDATTGSAAMNFDTHQYSLSSRCDGAGGSNCQTSFSMASSLGSDSHLSSSPGSCAPYIMARVQPMILNSMSPSTHQSLMTFQPAHAATAAASSPTSSSSSYSRHRELHKTLEKNRRAHLRHCFELLKSELPPSECADKKTSHINIIKSAIRYVLALRQQECEIDNELLRQTRIKIELTEKLSAIRNNNGDPTLIINHLHYHHHQPGQIETQQNRQVVLGGVSGAGRNNDVSHPVNLPSSMSNDKKKNHGWTTPPTTTSMLSQLSSQSTDGSAAVAAYKSSTSSSSSSSTTSTSNDTNNFKQEQIPHNQPVAEHQLSILLSQSKID